jgi:hypothetical protein
MPKALAIHEVPRERAPLHLWGTQDRFAVSFLLPQGIAPQMATPLIESHPAVKSVTWERHPSSTAEVTVEADRFDVAEYWGSFGTKEQPDLPAVRKAA